MARDAEAFRNELLVLRCQRGEDAAFAELVQFWERRLYYFIRRILPREDDAADALQKTWMQVVRQIHRLQDPGAFRVWLFRVARGTAISHLRGEMRRHDLTEQNASVEAEACAIDDVLLRLENAEFLHQGLSRLALPFREVLTLHFLEDMSIEEISGVLSLPRGTVKSRLYHARRALRRLLEEEMVHDSISGNSPT